MDTLPKPLLKSIQLRGFLSFSPHSDAIPLTATNVIIGPNGSGKSNLVEAFSVLRGAPRDLSKPIRQGGGVKSWLWSGPDKAEQAILELVFREGAIAHPPGADPAVRYRIAFGAEGEFFVVLDELIEDTAATSQQSNPAPYFAYDNGRPMLSVWQGSLDRGLRELARADMDPTQSILSQRKDPESYPELARLSDILGRIRLYRDWQFGPGASVRRACPPDVRSDYLLEDFSNLPIRLAVLKRDPKVKQRFIELLDELGSNFQDLEIVPEGGVLQLYVTEDGHNVPAHRLSDGTLRYLCLLAILLDPAPAPLVVIEEPELGMHPDILPTLRDLILEAGQRTQLMVTTHSSQLLDAMTHHADSVLVCERSGSMTQMTRLSQETVDRWIEHNEDGLGSLWISGQLGGTRW